MLRLTQSPIPLVILCMRAKYPMYEIKPRHLDAWKAAGGEGKPPKLGEWARSETLEPKQSDDVLYEMFVHGWIDKAHCFHGTKYTLDVLRKVFIDGEPITVGTGQRLAAWARGGTTAEFSHPPVDSLIDKAKVQAGRGTEAYKAFWGSISAADKAEIGPEAHAKLKAQAAQIDAGGAERSPDGPTHVRSASTSPGGQNPAGPPDVSFAQLADLMRKRRDRDMLDADADLIASLPEDQQAEARVVYQERLIELEGS